MTDPEQPAGDAPPTYDPAPRPGAEPVTPGVPPLASVIAKPASSSGRGTSLLLLLAGAIAIGGLAFAGGRLTAPAATATGRSGNGQFPGNGQGLPGGGQFPGNGQGIPGGGDGFGGGISLSGTVSAVSADAITVELASGTSITIPLDGKTAYHAATAATAGDVTVGSEVRVTPGARVADPGASLDPNASPGPGAGGIRFGAATDVTVIAP
jgi:hypothetical protein